MSVHEISFTSSNGKDTIKAWSYTPLDAPKAIVQLVHGFGEHSRRYLHMIDKLTEAGFVVYADDHMGHGKTGYDQNTLGAPGTVGRDGWLYYLADEKLLHDIAVREYPGLPYFMFGHSWGSMLARGYAAKYGEDLKGLLLCGVVSGLAGCDNMLGNTELAGLIDAGKGTEKGLEWMLKLFEGMTDRIENPSSPNAWIANDDRVVADHAADPFNCFDPTVQLIYDFEALYEFIESPDWAREVTPDIPCYLIAGDQDPCGNYGEGVYHVANLLSETGHPISVKLYSGYRHEIHNERAIRDEVEAGIIDFINGALA